MVSVAPDELWMVITGFIIAFVLAFGIGSNDVANSFGTSYGAKVLTLRQVCVLASVFETLGAVLLGAKVSDTIRKGIIDIAPYKNDTSLLMMGNVAALSGSCVWLMAATMLRMPVSATHSIVGATVGFALVAHGIHGINLRQMGMIIASWFISPLMAGAVSTSLFLLCKHFILNRIDPLESGLRWLPVFYAVTIVINLFSVFYDGPEMLHFDRIPLWATFVLSFGTGLVTALVVRFAVVPWQRRRIKAACLLQGDEEEVQTGSTSPTTKRGTLEANASQDEIAVEKANIVGTTGASEAMLEMERRDSTKKSSLDGADEKTHKKPVTTSFLHAPIPATGKVLTEITTPNDGSAGKPKALANGKGAVNKQEDAPLMDNEYRLGSLTPRRINTDDDLLKLKATSGGKQMTNGGKELKDVEAKLEELEEEDPEHSGREKIKDSPETVKLFSFLQILTAIFGGFAHGGNDVSNAIGPLVSLWLIGTTGEVSAKALTPVWILLYGGAGISVGLWLWGRRVMKTMGEDLTKITPSSGFCIEIGTAMTVLIASNIGIPISTTHCKVGSIVFVGRVRSRDNVDWSIFRNIVLAWLVTLPVSCGISAALMALFMRFV